MTNEIFKLVLEPKTWQANSYCQQHYNSDLATINSDYKNNIAKAMILNEELKSDSVFGGFAIGFTDINHEGIWIWINDDTQCGYTINNITLNGNWTKDKRWGSGEPQNLGGIEHCVRFRSDGYMVDYMCEEKRPFICDFDYINSYNSPQYFTDLEYRILIICAVLIAILCCIGFSLCYLYQKRKQRMERKTEQPKIEINIIQTHPHETVGDSTDEETKGFFNEYQELHKKYPKAAKQLSKLYEKSKDKTKQISPYNGSITTTTKVLVYSEGSSTEITCYSNSHVTKSSKHVI
eukprot:237028_1